MPGIPVRTAESVPQGRFPNRVHLGRKAPFTRAYGPATNPYPASAAT